MLVQGRWGAVRSLRENSERPSFQGLPQAWQGQGAAAPCGTSRESTSAPLRAPHRGSRARSWAQGSRLWTDAAPGGRASVAVLPASPPGPSGDRPPTPTPSQYSWSLPGGDFSG